MTRIPARDNRVMRCSPHLELLGRISIFEHLDNRTLADLYRWMTVQRWQEGAIVVNQNDPAGALHIVAQGRAKRVLFGENGREMTLSVVGRGDLFGEACVVDGKPCDASVVAMEDLVLLVLERQAFLRFIGENPQAALGLLTEMAGRLRSIEKLVGNLALRDVDARLRRALLDLAERHGEAREDGVFIRRRPTQQDLANMVGTCRETVSRTLSSLARRGLLVAEGRSLLLSPTLLDGVPEAA